MRYTVVMRKANLSNNVVRARAFTVGATVLLVALIGSTLDAHSLSAAAAPHGVKNEHVKIAIEGMHCTSCAHGIKAMLKRTPGVIAAEVSFERREAVVEYDSSRTSPEKIVEAIDKMGYKAKVKEEKEK